MSRRDAIIYKDLSEAQNVQIYDVECNNETDQLTYAESLLLECENLFNNNDGWKASTNESIDETVTRVKSIENGIQRKYEKVIKLRDAVKHKYEKFIKLRDALIEEKNDLKSKTEVILIKILGFK